MTYPQGARPKRIFDPIHHFIELDAAEVALLSTAPMQRLRRLRQLGLAYLAYPSAEHSRFSHVLGALAMGDRVLEALRRHSPEYFSSDDDFARQRRLLRASLLIHDIGHGPFSHACEAILGVAHEQRTPLILAQPDVARALEALELAPDEILGLVVGGAGDRYPVLRELVSGPNLDADRMDYLLRDGYFTGVASGRYDVDQLVSSLRVFEIEGRPRLGIDGRAVVALESFVLARYMMFATVYFHHTTRMFERVLQDVLRELWPAPRELDDTAAFLGWDDLRVMDATRTMGSEAAGALRDRNTLYGLAAEFNAERDLRAYHACEAALRERYGDAVWDDSQEQLLHRLPLSVDETTPTVFVRTSGGIVDAREASDVIAKLSGKAYWRKLFVKKGAAPIAEARALCREIVAGAAFVLAALLFAGTAAAGAQAVPEALAIHKEATLRIMTIGDSITAGILGEGGVSEIGGYRGRLAQLLEAGGYHVTFVGSRADYAVRMPALRHDGYPGFVLRATSAGAPGELLGPTLERALEGCDPDVILLMAGTNDFLRYQEDGDDYDQDVIVESMELVMRQIFRLRPHARVLLAGIVDSPKLPECTIARFDVGRSACQPGDFTSLRSLAERLAAEGHAVRYADGMFEALPRDLKHFPDGIHPAAGANGYDAVADVWYKAILTITADANGTVSTR